MNFSILCMICLCPNSKTFCLIFFFVITVIWWLIANNDDLIIVVGRCLQFVGCNSVFLENFHWMFNV